MASTTLPNGTSPPAEPTQTPLIETPYLIVGAGPAGASLACFLASHGLTGIIISAASGTAKEPRAHITNPAAQECLRDIGLEEAVLEEGTDQVNMSHTRWCHDMAGDEWARIHSWGCQPDRQGEYAAASPCKHVDCPQTILEPILINRARNGGWKVRFDSAFVEFARDTLDGPITSTIQDTLTGHKYQIRSKYLFGCDGGRSQVIRQLGIPLKKEPGQGLAINVHARMDLSKFMQHKEGVLHWTFQPEIDHPPWAWSVIVRMVEPWNEWMFIVLPEPGFTDFTVKPTHEECMKRMRQCVGDDSVEIEILDVAKWYINEIVAERYSDGNIFCLGDAVHRVSTEQHF
jgi:2-polyprenyl-6-methoxyphenol hydroxylase-like FAD-dependent oxidoreductase